jgi:hypothetical protein
VTQHLSHVYCKYKFDNLKFSAELSFNITKKKKKIKQEQIRIV